MCLWGEVPMVSGLVQTQCGNELWFSDNAVIDKMNFCPFCGRVLSEPKDKRYIGASSDVDGMLSCFEYNHNITKGG